MFSVRRSQRLLRSSVIVTKASLKNPFLSRYELLRDGKDMKAINVTVHIVKG